MRRIVLALFFCCSGLMFAQRPGPPPPPPGDPWVYGSQGPGTWNKSWNNRPYPKRGACFFRDWRYSGDRFCVRAGDRLPYLPGGFGNSISSIQLFGGARANLFDGKNFGGAQIQVRHPVTDMRDLRGPKGNSWNDRVSSMTVN
jgi:hypothetical protein